jgi:hypothetical protein
MMALTRLTLCCTLCIAAACGVFDGANRITILELAPYDSSTVLTTDTITVTADYEFESKYQQDGVILAAEMLCGEGDIGTVLNLDTLHAASAVIDVKFRLADFDTLCDYENSPSYHVLRLKLVLDRGSEYARVTVSPSFHYYHRFPL